MVLPIRSMSKKRCPSPKALAALVQNHIIGNGSSSMRVPVRENACGFHSGNRRRRSAPAPCFVERKAVQGLNQIYLERRIILILTAVLVARAVTRQGGTAFILVAGPLRSILIVHPTFIAVHDSSTHIRLASPRRFKK